MSELRANTISDLAGTGPVTLTKQWAAKSWINFDGTGTVSIRDSENVASLTDLGVGNARVTFTNALTDANYSVSLGTGSGPLDVVIQHGGFATTQFDVLTYRIPTGALIDQARNTAEVTQ